MLPRHQITIGLMSRSMFTLQNEYHRPSPHLTVGRRHKVSGLSNLCTPQNGLLTHNVLTCRRNLVYSGILRGPKTRTVQRVLLAGTYHV